MVGSKLIMLRDLMDRMFRVHPRDSEMSMVMMNLVLVVDIRYLLYSNLQINEREREERDIDGGVNFEFHSKGRKISNTIGKGSQ